MKPLRRNFRNSEPILKEWYYNANIANLMPIMRTADTLKFEIG